MLKNLLLLFAALLVSLVSAAQNCNNTFVGQVQDENNKPLIGATLLLSSNAGGGVSDASGNFRFDGLCNGVYHVTVQYLGYTTSEFDIAVEGSVKKIVQLKEDIQQLREVIVEDKTLNTDHAHNMVTLNAKQLAETAGKSLGESLKEIPGVNSIQTGPGIFKPVIHGVHSQRVLILNHGIRQEGQQWGAEHAPEIDPFIASDITVIKDASSIKYGTDALGGVVVVNPAPLPEEAGVGGSMNTIFQSNGRSGTVSGMLEGGVKKVEGLGWRIQGTGKMTGDFQTPDYVLTNTGVRELDFSAAVGYHKSDVGMEVFFSHFQSELGILKGTAIGNIDDLVAAMERDVPQSTSSFGYHIEPPRQTVSHNLLKLIGHVNTDHGEFRIQYGYQNNNRREYDIRMGDLSSIPALDLQLNTHTLETEWESGLHNGLTLCIGMTGMLQENKNIPGTKRIPFIPNFTSASGGLYIVTKRQFEKWSIDFGGRYDYRHYAVSGYDFKNTLFNSTLDFHNASATLGATVQVKQNQVLHLNLSSAWRPPHVSELYSVGTHQSAAAIEYGLLLNDSTNEVMNINDVSFKTEQALKWVGSYQWQWKNLQLDISPYANYIFNYIYLRPMGITENIRGVYPYFRYVQTDALFLGVDVSGAWQVHRYLKITPKVSLLRASDERNNDYLIFIPSNWYEIAARYERPSLGTLKNFFVESKTKYVSKQTRAPRVVTVREIKEAEDQDTDPFQGNNSNFDFMQAPDGYLLWNVSTGISVKGKKSQYDFRIGAENLLNTSYREYTNRFRYYADDLGRNFIVSIKCIF
jgi:iron complex outermembrane recepter protein